MTDSMVFREKCVLTTLCINTPRVVNPGNGVWSVFASSYLFVYTFAIWECLLSGFAIHQAVAESDG